MGSRIRMCTRMSLCAIGILTIRANIIDMVIRH
jgi:hypothetical protein